MLCYAVHTCYAVLCAERGGSLVGLRGNFLWGVPKTIGEKGAGAPSSGWAIDPPLGELSLAFGRLKYRVFIPEVILTFFGDRLRSTSIFILYQHRREVFGEFYRSGGFFDP